MKKALKILMTTLAITQMLSVGASAITYRYSDLSQIEEDIYNNALNRDTTYSFIYTGNKDDIKESLIKEIKNAYSKDDYLNKSWSRIGYSASSKDGENIKVTVTTDFMTTKEEEDYIDTELKTATNSIITANMSEYDKVKVINDYLINKYEYDYDLLDKLTKVNLGETSDLDLVNEVYDRVNVYSALKTSKTVCQGYSMSAYKMMKYAGLECEIVEGKLKGEEHLWNKVKVNDIWYYIDITNNDTTKSNKYFLVSKEYLQSQQYVWVEK
ncbi:MAG: transglutaminase domain-containing protein [Clostridium butyricum]|nr:transglutaminase domain-containing protein [Clostridium butyricum]